jgi:hypothetical protein
MALKVCVDLDGKTAGLFILKSTVRLGDPFVCSIFKLSNVRQTFSHHSMYIIDRASWAYGITSESAADNWTYYCRMIAPSPLV